MPPNIQVRRPADTFLPNRARLPTYADPPIRRPADTFPYRPPPISRIVPVV
jgi:hypothetical protein